MTQKDRARMRRRQSGTAGRSQIGRKCFAWLAAESSSVVAKLTNRCVPPRMSSTSFHKAIIKGITNPYAEHCVSIDISTSTSFGIIISIKVKTLRQPLQFQPPGTYIWSLSFIINNNIVTMSPVAIVTGGSSGIGLALVNHLVSLGWKVVIADINSPKSHIPETKFIHTDISSWDQQAAMFEEAYNWGKRLDFVALNAGVDDRDDIFNSLSGDIQKPPQEPNTKAFTVNISGT